MNIVLLKKDGKTIELLVNDKIDLSLITSNASKLFKLAQLYKIALADFANDYSADFAEFENITNELKNTGIVGYPVTPMKDARLYAGDKGIVIESELEINCNKCE